ncbi:major facilitator superfamily protein [Salinisphaera sp. C84B14]|uniref:AmpG family muropeptide MFS transporter n=1 Tax=Salinisphaera sp. C84B14 TaxID=1304155 RepID=UPI0033415CCD
MSSSSAADANTPPKRDWRAALEVYVQPRVVGMLFLGFSSGLPFLLVFSTLSAWLAQEGVSKTTIGFFSWIGMMYSIKFFWAPVVDRFPLPVLGRLLGRRRAWMLLAQIGLIVGLVAMALTDPTQNLTALAWFGLLVAFSSATQDVAIDAWRIEAVDESIQGAMAATYQAGYRIALLTAGAGAFYIASGTTWPFTYLVMAGLVGVGMITVLLVAEPEASARASLLPEEPWVQAHLQRCAFLPEPLRKAYGWVLGAVVCPLVDFFARYGVPAIIILLFVSLFRVTDITLGVMANPFYLDMHYSLNEIASVTKLFGIAMTLGGAALGGILIVRYGILKPLLASAILAASTNLAFAWLASQGADAQTMQLFNSGLMDMAMRADPAAFLWAPSLNMPWQPGNPGLLSLALTVSADNLSGGMAGSAFIAYLSSLTNTQYTATQYALFSSLMTLPGKYIGGYSGWVVDNFGYMPFFSYTALAGIPAIVLAVGLFYIHRHETPAHKRQESTSS